METTPGEEIRQRIVRCGKISFAEFMEVALYHPTGGYYSRSAPAGAHRDYYTSPAAHPSFGAFIAIQLRRMWELLGRPRPFHAIEMGAGRGLLAHDILTYTRSFLGPFGSALRYVAVDRSDAHLESDDGRTGYERMVSVGMPLKGVVGCFLSNELLDSFPVHRFQVRNGRVHEVYVTLHEGQLQETLGEPATPLMHRRIRDLDPPLPEGYSAEINLQIGPWMREVSAALKRGFVLTIDYGYETAELYSPERERGTLQTYYKHTAGSSPYERVGLQDITAHVDFSAVASEGMATGLSPVGLWTQAAFLRSLGHTGMLERLRTEEHTQQARQANMMGMRELVKPEGLGGFKVLVQEKDTGIKDPSELAPRDDKLPVPLLQADHVPLMEGRYPHAAWEPPDFDNRRLTP